MKKRLFSLALLALVSSLLFGVTTVSAKEQEPVCQHEVYCTDRTTCLICGAEDLEEKDITKVVHPYAYCYAPDICAECWETVPEDSVEELLHDVFTNSHFIPDGDMHWAVCFCGERTFDIPLPHQVYCQSPNQDICDLCGWQGQIEVTTHDEEIFSDEDRHWSTCTSCLEEIVPHLPHYTSCLDPDGPCDFCERAHEECNFAEEWIGFHIDQHHTLLNEGGDYYHQSVCGDCDSVVAYHSGIVFTDFGDEAEHGAACSECGWIFNDVPHGEHVIAGDREATCTKDGYTGDTVCEECGHVFEEGSVIKALGHDFKNGICTRCGARESKCHHAVYCDNKTTCILCGMKDLIEEEISEIRHPYAYCYDLSECGACKEKIEAGSAPEIRHDLDVNFKYTPCSRGHRVTCMCGLAAEKEIDKHVILCTQEDQTVCSLCGAPAGDADILHEHEHVLRNREHHWLFCDDCNEQTSPLLDHYTLCTDPDGPCGFCEMEHDECLLKPQFIGMHLDVDEISEEGGELYHISTCLECGQEIIRHKGLVYEDFGDSETHIVKCAECGHQFNDGEHGEKVLSGKRDAACTKDGFTGDLVCGDCGHKFKEGSVIKALGHEYKDGVCVRCGQKQQAPVTGDESHMMTWMLLMIGAAVCLILCARRFKRPEFNKK